MEHVDKVDIHWISRKFNDQKTAPKPTIQKQTDHLINLNKPLLDHRYWHMYNTGRLYAKL